MLITRSAIAVSNAISWTISLMVKAIEQSLLSVKSCEEISNDLTNRSRNHPFTSFTFQKRGLLPYDYIITHMGLIVNYCRYNINLDTCVFLP